jgi:hypothetical protein
MGWLGNLIKGALPAVGTAVLGPLGGVIGTGLSGALSGAESGAEASKLRKRAIAGAEGDYQARAPIRARAIQLALQGLPSRRDLSVLRDPTNPFTRRFGEGQPAAVNQVLPPVPGADGLGQVPPGGLARVFRRPLQGRVADGLY